MIEPALVCTICGKLFKGQRFQERADEHAKLTTPVPKFENQTVFIRAGGAEVRITDISITTWKGVHVVRYHLYGRGWLLTPMGEDELLHSIKTGGWKIKQ